MPNKVQFTNLYDTVLKRELSEVEMRRKNTLVKLVLFPVLLIVYFAILAYFEVNFLNGFFKVVTFLVVGVGGFVVLGAYGGFVKSFKNDVLKTIFSLIDDKIIYDHDKAVSERVFVDSQLFKERHSHFDGSDYISGKIGSTDFESSYLFVLKSKRKSRGKRKFPKIVFNGQFFSADFHKHINGITLVQTDSIEKKFGTNVANLIQKKNIEGLSLVRLDNPVFEDKFKIYTTDSVEAHYILTPDLMERILVLNSIFKCDVSISFCDSRMNIALASGKSFFSPSLYKTVLNKDRIYKFMQTYYNLLNLVEVLNLNTRIWTKV